MWRRHYDCTEAGLRAVLQSDSSARNERWGALLSLQSQLVAEGRLEEVRALLDDEANASLGARYVYVIDYGSTGDFQDAARDALPPLPEDAAELSTPVLWLHGVRAVRDSDAATLEGVSRILETRCRGWGRPPGHPAG